MQENINIPDSTITTNLSFRNLVLMNMQQLTNFPYIEKDFDALTDYELLCLVVKFLNDVIANQNEQNDSITRMYESFLALQDYVNNTKDELEDAFNNLDNYVRNYFNNLDVQEEINNKLDDMLEDGVLEQIIEQFLQLTSLICFDNVADMKSSVNLTNGSYAQTLGYYNKNDGGSALYKIRTITNDDVVDEMFIIEINDSSNELVAELIISDKVNILQLGAKKDKTEDIGNIVNLLINKGINTFIPDGEYIIENTININEDYYNLTCNGKLYIDDVVAINITSSYCNIDINNEIIGNTNGTGIKIGSNNDLVAHNNIDIDKIDNVSIGIHITPDNNNGVQYNKFNFSYINANKCIYFNPGDHSIPWINENTFTGGRLRGYYGIITEKGASQTDKFNGNKFLNIGFEGIYYGIKLDFAWDNIFDNMRMAERANYLIYWIDCASNSFGNIFNILSNVEIQYINDLSNLTPNVYNAPIFIDPQGIYFGNKLYIKNNIKICPDSNYFNNLNDYFSNYNYNGTVNKNVYTNQLSILAGGDDVDNTHDIILPAELFSYGCGFNKFYINVSYKPYNATIAIKDTNNNTIIDSSKLGTGTITNKFYEIFRTGSGNNAHWKIKEITIL